MASYQRLPTSPVEQHELQQQQQEQEQDEPELSTSNAYSRATLDEFNRPEPAWWKRALVIVAIIFSGWLAFRIGHSGNSKAKVIYATR
jgi:hypothetical protein